MIKILSKKDLTQVSDPVLVTGINKEFKRLPKDFQYPEYGYFIVIEELTELIHPIELNQIISEHTLRLLCECVEIVEVFEGYIQVLLVLNSDFGISLFINEKTISSILWKKLFGV